MKLNSTHITSRTSLSCTLLNTQNKKVGLTLLKTLQNNCHNLGKYYSKSVMCVLSVKKWLKIEKNLASRRLK